MSHQINDLSHCVSASLYTLPPTCGSVSLPLSTVSLLPACPYLSLSLRCLSYLLVRISPSLSALSPTCVSVSLPLYGLPPTFVSITLPLSPWFLLPACQYRSLSLRSLSYLRIHISPSLYGLSPTCVSLSRAFERTFATSGRLCSCIMDLRLAFRQPSPLETSSASTTNRVFVCSLYDGLSSTCTFVTLYCCTINTVIH